MQVIRNDTEWGEFHTRTAVREPHDVRARCTHLRVPPVAPEPTIQERGIAPGGASWGDCTTPGERRRRDTCRCRAFTVYRDSPLVEPLLEPIFHSGRESAGLPAGRGPAGARVGP